jgi:FkbM family methyltransferase
MAHILNRILPMRLRVALRGFANRAIPSLRHLDLPRRVAHLRTVGFMPSVIYDIGAASGDWARLAGKTWPEASIFGFEPNRREHDNLEQARKDVPKFQYRHAFLGPEPGTASYVDRGHQTSLLSAGGRSADSAQTAPVLVLDQLITDGSMPPPDLMKLDVQGFELQVLSGAEQAMKHSQAIILEISFYEFEPNCPLADEVIAFLKARSFVIYDVMSILRRESDDALAQMDMMFIKAGHPLTRGPIAQSAASSRSI